MKTQPLTIGVENEELIIRIGVSTLAFAVTQNDDWGDDVIGDEVMFAEDVARELEREDEQGSTGVHFLLDKMARDAAANGSIAISEPE